MEPISSKVIDWDAAPGSLDRIANDLQTMRKEAGSPSYREIARRIADRRAAAGVPVHRRTIARSTVYDCFRTGRSRIDLRVATEVAAALGLPEGALSMWAERVRAARASSDGATVVTGHSQVPPAVASFTGRIEVLARAERALGAAPIWLSGLGGVGKTQIALRLVERATNGGGFIDLRGFRAESVTVDAQAAGRAILRILGSSGQGSEDVAAAVRATDRLLILDDAPDLAHIEQILGHEPLAGVIVTSRARLPEDTPGWCAIDVGGLDTDEATRLLETLAGVAVDEVAAQRLARVTDGLPLAVALVASGMSTRTGWTLAEHLEFVERRMRTGRIDHELADTLDASYADLPTEAARLLRAFADLPIAELDAEAGGALLDVDSSVAQDAADILVSRSLAIARGRSGIALHALVRSFARDRAESTDAPRIRAAAFARLGWFLTDRVWSAYDTLHRALEGEAPAQPESFTYTERDEGKDDAETWLDEHLSTILQLAHAAPGRGHPELLLRISEGLAWWLKTRGRYAESAALHAAALEAAEDDGDDDAVLNATLGLCRALANTGHGDEAHARAVAAIEAAEQKGQPVSSVLGALLIVSGLANARAGRLDDAIVSLKRAAEIHEQVGDNGGLLSALATLGMAQSGVGDFGAAFATSAKALALAEASGNAMMAANIRTNQVEILADLGEYARALAVADEAIAAAESLGVVFLTAFALGSSAEAARRMGELAQARERIDRCVAVCRDVGDQATLTEALIGDAEIAVTAHDAGQARAAVDEADELLAFDGDPVLRGRIDMVRGDLADDPDESSRRWRQALGAFEAAGSHYAEAARERLAHL